MLNRITDNSKNIIIFNNNFLYFPIQNNGGVIFIISSYLLQIINCYFFSCYSTNYGGALFKENGYCIIEKTCFLNCSVYLDGQTCGNAFRLNKCNSNVSYNSIFKCSFSQNPMGDSPVGIYLSLFQEFYINYSYCYSANGPGGSSTDNCLLGSNSKYLQVINSYSHGILECKSSNYNYYNLNLINNLNILYYFYLSNPINIFNSIFFNNKIGIQLVYNNLNSITFFNCYSDSNLVPVNITLLPLLNQFNYNLNIYCNLNKFSKNFNSFKKYYFFFNILIFF